MPTPPISNQPDAPAPSGGWLRRRVLDPLLGLLRQGLSPEQLALTVALGVGIGCIPFLGAVTTLATLVALRLRLNVAALQLMSHLATPLQLVLLVPFLKLGSRLLGDSAGGELTVARIRHLFATDWRAALQLLWRAELGALALWLLAAVPVVALLYLGLRPLFRRMAARMTGSANAAEQQTA